jgi:hypothetical protein
MVMIATSLSLESCTRSVIVESLPGEVEHHEG